MGALIRLGLIALVVAIAVTFRSRFGDIAGALQTAGWAALAAVSAFHLLPMALCGLAWGSLTAGNRPVAFIMARWVRDGVSDLASFLPLAGEMAGARVLSCLGVRPALAGGLMVVDVTAEVLAQFVFSVLGVALWLARQPAGDVARSALWGLGLSVPVLLAFVLIQRSTIVRFLETLPSRLMPQTWRAPAEGAGIHAAIAALWTDHRRVGQAVLIHLAAWAVSTGEAWLALGLLHRPLPLADVLAMESIVFAVNSAAFFVPGALGVQEGSYLLLGAALGLPPEAALAVSLLKRGRALCLGLPALAAWHRLEQRSAKSA